MKAFSEQEIEIVATPHVAPVPHIRGIVKKVLSIVKSLVVLREMPDDLPARLQRDAGLDDTEAEYRRIAKAPLIR